MATPREEKSPHWLVRFRFEPRTSRSEVDTRHGEFSMSKLKQFIKSIKKNFLLQLENRCCWRWPTANKIWFLSQGRRIFILENRPKKFRYASINRYSTLKEHKYSVVQQTCVQYSTVKTNISNYLKYNRWQQDSIYASSGIIPRGNHLMNESQPVIDFNKKIGQLQLYFSCRTWVINNTNAYKYLSIGFIRMNIWRCGTRFSWNYL